MLKQTTPWFALLLLALLTILSLGRADFYTRGEAREGLVVQSIVTSGEWILPRGYGNAVASKPPLFHWLSAITAELGVGISEWSIRFPSALFSFLTITFFLLALRDRFSRDEQLLFVIMLFSSFGWMRSTVSARVDMVHAGSLACGLLAGFRALETGKHKWHIFAGLLFGLAVLAKGPVGIALPGAVMLLWAVYRKVSAGKTTFFSLGFIFGLSCLLSLPWYVAAYRSAPAEFSARVWYENVSRFTSAIPEVPHEHSAPFLVLMLLVETLPWSLVGMTLSWKTVQRTRREGLFTVFHSFTPLVKFSILAVTVILFFYCIPAGKRGVYLLPTYPFLALLTVSALRTTTLRSLRQQRLLQLGAGACVVFFLAQFLVVPLFVSKQKSERPLAAQLRSLAAPNENIFSLGFEFYGTSFYLGRTIYRYEEVLDERAAIRPKSEDLLISPEVDWQRIAASNSVRFQPMLLGRVRIDNRDVIVARIHCHEEFANAVRSCVEYPHLKVRP